MQCSLLFLLEVINNRLKIKQTVNIKYESGGNVMGNELLKGVNAYGVRTPLIQIGDDLKKIVFDSNPPNARKSNAIEAPATV